MPQQVTEHNRIWMEIHVNINVQVWLSLTWSWVLSGTMNFVDILDLDPWSLAESLKHANVQIDVEQTCTQLKL